MFTVLLYLAAAGSLLYSYRQDRKKTKKSLMVAKKSFLNMLPDLVALFILVAIVLTLAPPSTIQKLIGGQSGFWGMLVASVVGSITLIPGFIAFPLAKSLLDVGAGLSQVVIFISTLMMVGLATAPMEIRYFGKKQTLIRNGVAFMYAFVVAFIVGGILG
ncbi:MAG: permease [Firmicutes bacterium]|nr:permease [Bacillota bacterium]